MGVQKKDLKKKSSKMAHVANYKAKEELRRKKDGKVKLTMTEDNGKVHYEKATSSTAKVSEFKRKKVEKNLNEKKLRIKEAEAETVEKFDDQGFFVLPANMQISAEDEDILKQFSIAFDTNTSNGVSTAKPAASENLFSDLANEIGSKISQRLEEKVQKEYAQNMLKNPKVKVVYQDIAKLLSHYRSGKLARAFVIIPSLEQWEEVLELTKPQDWTPQALFASVRLFSSSFDGHRAKIFYQKVILPAVTNDIKKYKKLNAHLYNALKKALYKPAAWFKGIIFPLLNDPQTTVKEAQIISSLLSKMTVPVMHSAACLLRLCSMQFSGPICVLMKTLIEKRYALPNRVIDGVVEYFARFVNETKVLPVLWHQMVLKFCEFYSGHFNELQKKALKQLVKKQNHHQISSEIVKAIDGDNIIMHNPRTSKMIEE